MKLVRAKDIDGSSRIYSLSEYNIHNTANIENGYLNGRYGGIHNIFIKPSWFKLA